jgi:Na+-translocating ferredoxin:NAD+ oxidoreductase subunit G
VSAPSGEPSGVRLAATLAVVGLIAGLALVATYEATLPTIEANQARALRDAVKVVVPGSSSMQKLVLGPDGLRVAAEGDESPGVYAAYDAAGAFRGYAIVGAGPGFQDVIRLIYGFDPDRRVLTGMSVLESRETPGLGDKIYKDAAYVGAFDGLSVDPQVVSVKKGAKSQPYEIEAITGATISCNAVAKIINEGNRQWLDALPRAAGAPALVVPGETAGSEEPSR